MARHARATTADSADVDSLGSSDAGVGVSLKRIIAILARPELKRWRPAMAFALVLTIVSKLLAVAAPVWFGEAVNRLEDGPAAVQPAVIGLLVWSAARFLSAGLPYWRDAIFSPISQDAQRVIAVDAYGHAQGLSLSFHQTRRTGALNRVIDRGVQALDFLIRFLGFNIGPTLVELVLAAIVLASVYGGLTAVTAVGTVAVYAVFTGVVTEWRTQQRRKLNEADTELRARAIDALANFETVKAFASEDRETARYDAAMRLYNVHMVETSRSLAVLNAGQELVMSVGLALAAVLALLAGASGQARPGDVAAVTLIMMNLYRPLNILGWAFREIRQGGVDLEKLYGLMDKKPEVADAPGAPPLKIAGGEVVFDGVGFAHDARSAGLADVSFTIPAGTRTAIVGPSGSGKSTLLKLLFRFYDVAGGRVMVDGVDVREVTQASLRQAIGLVPQDVVLFNTTLRENIIYGRPEASDADVAEACRKAQLSDFIASLPQGLETRVGERGVKLSGGEKQRVGLARAILKDPAILVLDEATSALDSVTEAEVQAALDDASQGRTTLVVAHRLSTIAGADQIIVLEAGRIAERGSHAELLARGGVYAGLWARQARTGAAEGGSSAPSWPAAEPASDAHA